MEIKAHNEVLLVGRMAAPAEERELPSGDVLTSWRLVVERPPSKRPLPEGVRATTIDTLDCVAWTKSVQRSVAAFAVGDIVSVEGSLRRRFWRGGEGPSSRYEVEVAKCKRLAKAPQAVA